MAIRELHQTSQEIDNGKKMFPHQSKSKFIIIEAINF